MAHPWQLDETFTAIKRAMAENNYDPHKAQIKCFRQLNHGEQLLGVCAEDGKRATIFSAHVGGISIEVKTLELSSTEIRFLLPELQRALSPLEQLGAAGRDEGKEDHDQVSRRRRLGP